MATFARARAAWSVPLALLVLFSSACKYTTQYTPPYDGRPRVVWHESDLAVDFAGAELTEACAHEIAHAIGVGGFDVRMDGDEERGADPVLRQKLLERAYEIHAPRETSASGGVFIGISGGGHHSSGSGSSGKDAEALAIVLILLLAPIDMYLSLAPPESGDDAALAIDLVNGYHEAMRLRAAGCFMPEARDGAAEPGGAR